jgi:hypothetical protein
MKNIGIILLTVLLFAGCNTNLKEENLQLLVRLDSMQMIVEEAEYLSVLLTQIEEYMDSIDIYRNEIKLDLEANVLEEDYVARMKNINEFVKKAEWLINDLSNTNASYNSYINRLKNDIEEKNKEIEKMQYSVMLYQEETSHLQEQLTETDKEVLSLKNELKERTSDFNIDKTELLNKLILTEAESLFARGEGKEELAKHMQFARKRKRQALLDAIKYYDDAYEMGYEPALARANQIKEKMKIN